jgi:hypothetical protein
MAVDDELALACSAIITAAAGVISLLITGNRKRKHSVWVKCVSENELFFIFSCAKTCIPNAGFILYGIIHTFVTLSCVADVNS